MSTAAPPLGAAVPAQHMGDRAPASMAVFDLSGAQPDADANLSPVETMRWRAPSVSAAPGPGSAAGLPALTAVHMTAGAPDPRHTMTGPVGLPFAPDDPGMEPYRTRNVNARALEVIAPQNRPVPNRAGSSGLDPTRPSTDQRVFSQRPFDMWASRHPLAVDKTPQQSPKAGTPILPPAVPQAVPSPGGAGAATVQPVGVLPNTFRLIPDPWDTFYVTAPNPDGAAAAVAAQRAAGWRA